MNSDCTGGAGGPSRDDPGKADSREVTEFDRLARLTGYMADRLSAEASGLDEAAKRFARVAERLENAAQRSLRVAKVTSEAIRNATLGLGSRPRIRIGGRKSPGEIMDRAPLDLLGVSIAPPLNLDWIVPLGPLN